MAITPILTCWKHSVQGIDSHTTHILEYGVQWIDSHTLILEHGVPLHSAHVCWLSYTRRSIAVDSQISNSSRTHQILSKNAIVPLFWKHEANLGHTVFCKFSFCCKDCNNHGCFNAENQKTMSHKTPPKSPVSKMPFRFLRGFSKKQRKSLKIAVVGATEVGKSGDYSMELHLNNKYFMGFWQKSVLICFVNFGMSDRQLMWGEVVYWFTASSIVFSPPPSGIFFFWKPFL
jgi:hypothetical protein